MHISLLFHIVVGLLSILLCMTGFFRNAVAKKASDYAFVPSVILVIVSGVGLTVSSGDITRSCISGIMLLTVLYGVRMSSVRYSLATRNKQ